VRLWGGEEVKVAQSEGSLYFSHSLAFIESLVSFYFPVPSLSLSIQENLAPALEVSYTHLFPGTLSPSINFGNLWAL